MYRMLATLVLLYAIPLLKADGNCQAVLQPFARGAQFTLAIHSLTGWVSYSNGTIQAGQYVSVPQYFSDRLSNSETQPYAAEKPDRLGLLLDHRRSQLETTLETWGNGKTTIDLFCSGSDGVMPQTGTAAIMRGTTSGQELSLLLTTQPIRTARPVTTIVGRAAVLVAPPVSRRNVAGSPLAHAQLPSPLSGTGGGGCERCDTVQRVPYPPEFGPGKDVGQSAALALNVLQELSQVDPGWFNTYRSNEPRDNTADLLNLRLRWISIVASKVVEGH